MNYHRLLSSQIKEHLKNDPDLLKNTKVVDLLATISDSYEHADKNNNSLKHSLELISKELRDRYKYSQIQLRNMQEAKEEQDHLFSVIQSTLDSSLDGILLMSIHNLPIFMNKQVFELFNTTEKFLISEGYNGLHQLVSKQTRNATTFIEQLKLIEIDSNITTACILEFIDGKIVEVTSKVRAQNNKNVGRIWKFDDITESRYQRDTTGYKAYHDILTSLPNRHLFSEHVNAILAKQKINNREFFLMYLDLDGFKFVNDTLGHEVGDEVLKKIAKRIKRVITDEIGMVARHGGDEFLIIIENYENKKEVDTLIQEVLDVTSEYLTLNGGEYYLSSSIGVSVAPKDSNCASTLIRNADMAMHHAKQNTKNCYMYFEPTMADKSKYELHLKSELHFAMHHNEFQLFFQPKIDMKTRKLVGAEALIRWFRNGKQYLFPNDFISTAERTGLIVPISEWVFEEAIKQVATWGSNLPEVFAMGINVSPQHFKYVNMVEKLKELVQKYDIAPKNIEFEVTEGVVMDNPKDNIEKLEELKNYGFGLSIDDFGTGYSSFNYLKDLPINTLKIDRSFILNIESSKRDLSLVASIIDIAHTLNLQVVIEGIETEQAHELIRDIGCDMAQGYYYGRPMPVEDFEKLLI